MPALRRYFRGHNLVAMQDVQAGQTRYYHFDHQGTTQALTDSTGAVTDRFASDAWGVQVKRTGTSINRHWYIGNAGYHAELDNNRNYVRARYLTGRNGVWMSIDPLMAGAMRLSLYRYVHGTPTRDYDPSGHYGLLDLGCIDRTNVYCGDATGAKQCKNMNNNCLCYTSNEICSAIANIKLSCAVQSQALLCCYLAPCAEYLDCINKCLYNAWRGFPGSRTTEVEDCWRKVAKICGPVGSSRQNTVPCCDEMARCEQTQSTDCRVTCGGSNVEAACLKWIPTSVTEGFPIGGTQQERIAAAKKACCRTKVWNKGNRPGCR